MKKIIIFIAIIVILTGCNTNYSSKKSNSFNNTESSNTIPAINKDSNIKKEFIAHKKGTTLDPYDFDEAYKMCIQAISEYQEARINKKEIDFSKYIENEKLITYLDKKLKSPNHYMNEGEVNKIGLIEFEIQHSNDTKFDKDRMYLYMAWGNIKETSGFSTTVEFIVTNSNGKLVISEWYDNGKDTFDTSFRGDLEIKKNDLYWKKVDIDLLEKKIAKHID